MKFEEPLMKKTKKELVEQIKTLENIHKKRGLVITYNGVGIVNYDVKPEDVWTGITISTNFKIPKEGELIVSNIQMFNEPLSELEKSWTVTQTESFPSYVKRMWKRLLKW